MESAQRNKIDLDEVLANEIKFGKYQIFVLLLIAYPIFLYGIYDSLYIFTAGNLKYRCEIPQCEHPTSEFHPPWLNISTPFDVDSPEKCQKFQYISNDTVSCKSESFNHSNIIGCDSFVYETDELTIQNQFGLTCSKEYQLSLIGTISNVGHLVCYIIVGLLSDRLGRKIFVVFCCLVNFCFGIMRFFASSYYQYAIIEFFDAALGSGTYSAAYIIGLELVTPNLRTIFGTILNCCYALGAIYLGFIAMWLKNYKHLLLVIYIPYLIVILHILLLPQSVRWLLSKGKHEDVKKIFNTACKFNGTSISTDTLNSLDEKIEKSNENIANSSQWIKKMSRKIVLQIAILAYLWFSIFFVYYGLNRNSVFLEFWNKYINFIFVCSIELPGYFITNILLDKLGRKKTLFIGMFGSGVFLILAEFIPGNLNKTIFFVCGKLLITIAFSSLYIFTVEIFPTNMRHSFLLLCSIVGRVGSTLMPLTPLLAEISPSLPLILFSSFSFTSAVLLCYLPETQNKKLPENMDDAFN